MKVRVLILGPKDAYNKEPERVIGKILDIDESEENAVVQSGMFDKWITVYGDQEGRMDQTCLFQAKVEIVDYSDYLTKGA